jgi:hypothetical protein
MPSHQEYPGKYQQDEGTSGGTCTPKRYRRSDQRYHPGTGPHDREAEDQAQPRHVYHRLVEGLLRSCGEPLCVTQGIPRGDAGSRVVGAEEDSEDTDGPATHHHSPPLKPCHLSESSASEEGIFHSSAWKGNSQKLASPGPYTFYPSFTEVFRPFNTDAQGRV